MTISRHNIAALYEQIAAELRAEIARGRFDPSGLLPSETELGARYSVSRVTVRLALKKLDSEGLIERRQGKGTYVAGRRVQYGLDALQGFHDALVLQGLAADKQLLLMEERPLPEALRSAMKTRAKTGLFLRRLHLLDGKPLALANTQLPPQALTVSRQDADRLSSYMILTELLGWSIERAELKIRVESADRESARALGTEPGAALLVMQRTSYRQNGGACEQTVFQIRPEHYELVLNTPSGIRLPG